MNPSQFSSSGCVEAFSLPQYANHTADCGLYTLMSRKCVVYTCKERHHLEVILFEDSQSKLTALIRNMSINVPFALTKLAPFSFICKGCGEKYIDDWSLTILNLMC